MRKILLLIISVVLLTGCSLSSNVDSEKETTRKKEVTYEEEVKGIIEIINSDINEIKNYTKPLLLLDSTEEMSVIMDKQEEQTSNANEVLTKLEDVSVPAKYETIHENLTNSMRDYRDNLQNKLGFYKENQYDITSSNSLAKEGNWVSMGDVTDFQQESEKLDSNLEMAVQNMEQRLANIEEKFNQ
ncbi:lipoprotein [Niallia sp. RD1]|uniref:lipoprotein n=1 Tax=Niallia sp. RD1 TaxID=2962858 RepID=UPI0020C1A0B1|nr:lipoprotein [Niallia sp. RD1]UTI42428.1 lipoprotein [Niallia sp. RD1]